VTTRIKTAALVALAITAGAVLLAVGVVLPALRAAEAEHQRPRAAEAGLAPVKAEESSEQATKVLVGDFPDYHSPSKGELGMLLRRRATPNDADDPLAGLDVLADEVAKPQTGEP
jgi:hypothetical protein